MVTTLMRSTLREIRQSMGRYLAILAIVGLGVGFFAGLRMSEPDMKATGVAYLDTYRLYDLRLISTLGFTAEDVDYFSGLDGVAAARGSLYTEFLWHTDAHGELVLTAHALTEGVNEPELVAGRLPESSRECLGDARLFSREQLGSAIRVADTNDEDTRELLVHDEYTLVGLAYTPLYLNYERGSASIGSGRVSGFVLLPEDGFDSDAYYEIYIRLADLPATYSQAYDDHIDGLLSRWEDLTRDRADLRYTTLHADAMEEIRDGEAELSDGWAEYRAERADAEKELADARQELTDGEEEYREGLADYEQGRLDYADGLRQYEDGRAELEDVKIQLDDALARLEEAKIRLEDAKGQLEEGESSYAQLSSLYQSALQLAQATGTGTPAQLMAALTSGASPALNASVNQALQAQGSSLEELLGGWQAAEASIGQELNEDYLTALRATLDRADEDYRIGLAEYEEGLAGCETGLAEYEEGLAELEEARIELADARQELADAPDELADARQELDDGWAEYYEGLAEAEQEFADAERELADGEQEIADAYAELEDLKEARSFVLTRGENQGYACFDNDTAIVRAISVVFPVFFFLVAALVCMTTMTRMVDEQRTQIGVLKAMGYSNGQIMGKYLFYSGSAATLGSLMGYAVGSTGLPWILWQIYGIMYGFAPLRFTFDPALAALSFGAALLCSMGATFAACRSELKKPAAELIRPKAPKAGQRVFLEHIAPLWRRLSFLHKVSVRNVLRYRSRLVMMVLGIGGCTALLVTGFGIRDSISNIADDQFDTITLYDYAVAFHDPQTPESARQYLLRHGWEPEQGLLVHSGSMDISGNSVTKTAALVISSENHLTDFISLHSGEAPIPYPGRDEVVVNVRLAESLGVRPGDTVKLRDEEIGSVTATVSAVCDNYVQNYIYMAPETYEAQMGQAPEYQTLYVLARGSAAPEEEGVLLAEGDEVSMVTVNRTTRDSVNSTLQRLDLIVIVVVLCAAALAFIVLYNLTNINITERIREIATIRVLGFYHGEVSAYVFREVIMLSVLGSGAGLLLGKALHAFVIAQIQVDGMFFPTRVLPLSYGFSFLLTILFTALITWGMGPRLRRVDMAESLKSIE